MKDLRSFHAKTCFVPDQFHIFQGHIFPVHSRPRGQRMGRKKVLSQRAVG